jgi:hypothetical protein
MADKSPDADDPFYPILALQTFTPMFEPFAVDGEPGRILVTVDPDLPSVQRYLRPENARFSTELSVLLAAAEVMANPSQFEEAFAEDDELKITRRMREMVCRVLTQAEDERLGPSDGSEA